MHVRECTSRECTVAYEHGNDTRSATRGVKTGSACLKLECTRTAATPFDICVQGAYSRASHNVEFQKRDAHSRTANQQEATCELKPRSHTYEHPAGTCAPARVHEQQPDVMHSQPPPRSPLRCMSREADEICFSHRFFFSCIWPSIHCNKRGEGGGTVPQVYNNSKGAYTGLTIKDYPDNAG